MTRRGNGPGHGGPARGGDARGYSWPAFEPGNTAAMTYGAHSERVVAPRAEKNRDKLIAEAPWLAAPAFDAAVNAWSRAEAQIAVAEEWLSKNGGPFDEAGNPKPVVEHLRRWEKIAMDARSRLGLDPMSAAKLQRDLGHAARDWNIASLLEEGRRLRAARGV